MLKMRKVVDVHCHIHESAATLSSIPQLVRPAQLWIMGTRPEDWSVVEQVILLNEQ